MFATLRSSSLTRQAVSFLARHQSTSIATRCEKMLAVQATTSFRQNRHLERLSQTPFRPSASHKYFPGDSEEKGNRAVPYAEEGSSVFVGGLPFSADEAALEAFFESAGPVTSARVISDKSTGRSKGFGYVDFETPEAAERAITEFHGAEMDGRTLNVNRAEPRKTYAEADRTPRKQFTLDPESSTVYVGNLSYNATQKTLEEVFEDFGTINEIRLITDRETGQPRGFGYVEFSSLKSAKAAVEAGTTDGLEMDGRRLRLNYAAAAGNKSGTNFGGQDRRGGKNSSRRGGGWGSYGDRENGGRASRGSRDY